MSTRTTASNLLATFAALVLVIGLTILATGVLTNHDAGSVIITGAVTTALSAIATAATGYRAVRAHIRRQVEAADSAALAQLIIRHDAQFTAAPNILALDQAARRIPRESTT